MSDQGAIKKTSSVRTRYRSASTQKLGSQAPGTSVDELEYHKIEKRDRRREPQIREARVSSDRLLKSGTTLPSKYVLPDKNPVKLKQLSQNGLSSPKSSPRLDYYKRRDSLKTKSETTHGSSTYERIRNSAQKPARDRVQSYYNEKRGESSVYAPKDAADKLSSFSKTLETRKSREKELSSSTEKPRLSSRERRRSRTLSPSEVKVLNSKINQDKLKAYSQDSDFKLKTGYKYPKSDDYEDYDSDLEDYISGSQIGEETDNSELDISLLEPIELKTEEKKRVINSALIRKSEEERMLDSGHYELGEAKKRAAMVESLMTTRIKTPSRYSPPLSEIEKSIDQSFREEKQTENKSLPSSTDEGFEDSQSGDFIKTSTSQVNTDKFEKQKQEPQIKKTSKKRTRGQILMSMVKLDTIEISLYETKPIPYDEFIRCFGKLNTQQIYTQTNEDNLDIEIQTETIEAENKWTQFPVACRNNLKTSEDVKMFKIEHIGVGGDKINRIPISNPSFDLISLSEFLSRAGKLILALLEEQESGGNLVKNENHEFPFSEGCIKLSVNSISFLSGRKISMLQYSEISNKVLISIHAPSSEKINFDDKQNYIKDCCIGCVWNVNEPSRPIKIFYSQNSITACCFHCTNNNIVFAGLQDGSICLWDLREEEIWHQKVNDKTNEIDWIIRSPTYTTSGNWEIESHTAPIVAIRIVSKMDQDETENLNDKFVSIQICSLDEDGKLIIWSVLRNLSHNSDDLGLSPWGKVKLVKSQDVPYFTKKISTDSIKKQFTDMNVDSFDSNNVFIATSGTDIFYANCIGGRNNIPYYKINEIDSCGSTTCIEVCPFKQSYFLAGCEDGSIRLHSLNIETPILKLKDEDSSAAVKSIQWSRSKPLTVYVLDNHHCISVWDLSNSDIHPTHKVTTKSWGSVGCMRLSACHSTRDMLNQYLALGTDLGYIEVHKLSKDHYHPNKKKSTEELNTFLRYVSIL